MINQFFNLPFQLQVLLVVSIVFIIVHLSNKITEYLSLRKILNIAPKNITKEEYIDILLILKSNIVGIKTDNPESDT